MKLILVRHGQSVENAKKILQGQIDGTLSDLGKEQAKKVAKRLASKNIDIMYSSDLKRAFDTAKEIRKFHKDIPFTKDKRLRERYFSTFEGKHELDDGWWNHLPADAETPEDMIRRAKSFILEMVERYPDKTVLAVTHGGFKRAASAILHKKKWDEVHSEFQFKNTSVSIYDITEKHHKPILVGCTKHLNEEKK